MTKQAHVVTDLSYGDAGKGTTVDYLARQASSSVVVRHSGGAQAAHNVVTPDGRHHTFAQFGSGSFVPNSRTHLSRFMLVNPLNMYREAEHLINLGVADIWNRLSVDRDALVVTPWHSYTNRIREIARGEARHGSCGQGIGETQSDGLALGADALRVRDLSSPDLHRKLVRLQHYKIDQLVADGLGPNSSDEWRALVDPFEVTQAAETYQIWASHVNIVGGDYLKTLAEQNEALIFEGSQGVLLDETHGFHPYTTWSTTTEANAITLLGEISYNHPTTLLGVMRAYTTRHGPGPFVTQDDILTKQMPDLHNGTGRWQGGFRVGYLDLVAHRYALAACRGISSLVVTGLDRVRELRACTEYRVGNARVTLEPNHSGDLVAQEKMTNLLFGCEPQYQDCDSMDGFLGLIEREMQSVISLTSWGPTTDDKRVEV